MNDPHAIMKILTDAREREHTGMKVASFAGLKARLGRHLHAVEVLDSLIADMARELGPIE